MQLRTNRFAPPKRKKAPSKLIAGLTAFIATGIITASGFAGATPGNNNGNGNKPPGHNNSHHNGQTVHAQQGGTISHGYGGGNTSIINNINLNLNNSNNNAITIIIHILNR